MTSLPFAQHNHAPWKWSALEIGEVLYDELREAHRTTHRVTAPLNRRRPNEYGEFQSALELSIGCGSLRRFVSLTRHAKCNKYLAISDSPWGLCSSDSRKKRSLETMLCLHKLLAQQVTETVPYNRLYQSVWQNQSILSRIDTTGGSMRKLVNSFDFMSWLFLRRVIQRRLCRLLCYMNRRDVTIWKEKVLYANHGLVWACVNVHEPSHALNGMFPLTSVILTNNRRERRT